MDENSLLFRRTLFQATLNDKKLTLFRCKFFNTISMVNNRRYFAVSMYSFGGILMDWQLTHFWHAYADVLVKEKNWWWFWYLFLIIFQFAQNQNCLDVSYWRNLVLMCFFNVISLKFEICLLFRCLKAYLLVWRLLGETSDLSKFSFKLPGKPPCLSSVSLKSESCHP